MILGNTGRKMTVLFLIAALHLVAMVTGCIMEPDIFCRAINQIFLVLLHFVSF